MVRGTKNVPSDKEKYVCNGTPIREFPIERFNTPFWCGELMSRFSDEIEKYSGSDQTRVRRNDLPPAEKMPSERGSISTLSKSEKYI